MNDDIGKIENDLHTILHYAEIVAIDRPRLGHVIFLAVVLHHLPVGAFNCNDVCLILVVVKETPDSLGTSERNIMLATISSCDNCNFFHCFVLFGS